MDWLKSKTTIVAVIFLAVAGFEGYAMLTMRSAMNERISSIEEGSAKADEKMSDLSSDLGAVADKVGVTEKDLQDAQELAKQLKLENAQLRRSLNAKADSKSVMDFQKDTATKWDSASTRIDGINGDVKGVRTDLESTRGDLKTTRSDLDSTRSDLKATREEMAKNHNDLGTLIARNSTELAELRRKGERDYFEFDLTKDSPFKRVGDIMLQLKKTDPKKQKYEVVINADDKAMQKKDRNANEPVSFVVGKERLHYELVVNYIDKDRVRGYISSPKDRVKTAETLQ